MGEEPRENPGREAVDTAASNESESDAAVEEPAQPEPVGAEVSELDLIRQERDSHLDDLQRLKAEFENYRKRVMREQTELVERSSAALLAHLLGVLDNFDLAVAAAEETKDFDKMLKGVELVYGELKEVLGANGLETIDAKNKPFDPNLHEAAIEVGGAEDGELVVAEVLRPGYLLKGRVLRPAMVKVTRR